MINGMEKQKRKRRNNPYVRLERLFRRDTCFERLSRREMFLGGRLIRAIFLQSQKVKNIPHGAQFALGYVEAMPDDSSSQNAKRMR